LRPTIELGKVSGLKTAKASRPSGFIALRIFAKVATGSAKNMTPKREKTKSKQFAGNM
jgi:hypothetical protein